MWKPSSEFLASGARLGTWWVPADDDLNDKGNFDGLPQRRDPGVLLPSCTDGWALLLERQLPAKGVSPFASRLQGHRGRSLMWGKVPGSAISLFDGRMGPASTEYGSCGSYSHSVWRGGWYVDSPTTWVDNSSKVKRIDIEFAAAAAWSERPPGQGLDINFHRQWDDALTTFVRPKPIVYQAVIGEATVHLGRHTIANTSRDRLDLRLSTVLSVEDDVDLGDVRHKWVVPLYDLLSFFWLHNPGVVRIRVHLAESDSPAEVHYEEPLARVDEDSRAQTPERLAEFATLQGILAHGYSFEDLLCGYWQWREEGYGRALELLNESQDPLLDQSLDAQLLNAFKSVESYIRTQTGKRTQLDKASEQLLYGTGRIGTDIRGLWQARNRQHFENAIARLRSDYVAHEQSSTTDISRSRDDLLDQYSHLVALQWLLRCTYLQAMGIDPEAARDLVSSAPGYKRDSDAMHDHFRQPTT